jgi:AcrR family transcriptional regulator
VSKPCRTDGADAAVPFAAYLGARFAAEPPRRKSQRTRERLRIGTAIALEQRGFHDVRVCDIAAAADTSPAALYCYFRDKTDAALQVLQPFATLLFDMAPPAVGGDAREDLTTAFQRVFALVCANPGLIRANDQLRDLDPSWRTRTERCAQIWHRSLAQSVLRHHPNGAPNPLAAVHGVADVLAALTDGLARRASRPGATAPDVQALVQIWLSALYPEPEPAAQALAAAA